MTNELASILDDLDYCKNREHGFVSLNCYECDLLLSYITNLQEEIKRQSKAQVILDNQIAEMFKYKSINEKAIDKIAEILDLVNGCDKNE